MEDLISENFNRAKQKISKIIFQEVNRAIFLEDYRMVQQKPYHLLFNGGLKFYQGKRI